MQQKLNVLHIASFIGNIGDNANHNGLKFLTQNYLNYKLNITKKEIREFYWKKWFFNSQEFIDEANKYDLIIIGGGNYFELWVENSTTGTSIDLSIDSLKKIDTPVLFYSLGCDIWNGVPDINKVKFDKYLNYITKNNKYFVSVRNDGALENIRSLYKNKYNDNIHVIPDAGFFTSVEEQYHVEIEDDKTNILINIAGDMLEQRFLYDNYSYKDFVSDFAQLINSLYIKYKKINFIFAAHIYRDIKTIYDILDNVDDQIRRKNIKIAPYLTGKKGHDYIFSLYKNSDLILANRFHANVCSYALKKNVIGLVNYMQIYNLYKEIDSKEFVLINKPHYHLQLKNMINEHLTNKSKYINQANSIYNNTLNTTLHNYLKLNKWLDSFFKNK